MRSSGGGLRWVLVLAVAGGAGCDEASWYQSCWHTDECSEVSAAAVCALTAADNQTHCTLPCRYASTPEPPQVGDCAGTRCEAVSGDGAADGTVLSGCCYVDRIVGGEGRGYCVGSAP
ncbi:MAG: hypothetical protein HY905_20230 [Deltaproteobacteria bacterium]|nr:hypothetical protein [Deltaproteobacteria bacterium]